MTRFTPSMKNLKVKSQGKTYTLTGLREYDPTGVTYKYQTTCGKWLDGKAMQFSSGGIEKQFKEK